MMSKTERAKIGFASWFMPGNGWRAFGAFMALALIYNGWTVGVEFRGVPIAAFLSSSWDAMAKFTLLWAVILIAVGVVTLGAELLWCDAGVRCVLQGGNFVLWSAAALGVLFSPQPPLAAGRYILGAIAALMVALAAARAERVENELGARLSEALRAGELPDTEMHDPAVMP